MDISGSDTSQDLEHKMKKRKQEQFDSAPEVNNVGSVCSGSEDASSMDHILSENDPAPDATLIICSKLESKTGQSHPEICNPEGNVHEKEHNDDHELSNDMDAEHENINGSGNLILNTVDIKQNVARYSSEMDELSSTNAYKEGSRISEDPSARIDHDDHGKVANVAQELSKEMIDGTKDGYIIHDGMEELSSTNAYKEDSRISEDPIARRDHDDHGNVANAAQALSKEMIDGTKDGCIIHDEMEEPSSTNAYKEDSRISEYPSARRDHDDQGNIANVAQELSKEMIDGTKDGCIIHHSTEKASDSDDHLPCKEQEYERDDSLKTTDIEQIDGACGSNVSEKIVKDAMEEASVCCSVGENDVKTSPSKEQIILIPSCMPPEQENADTVKEEEEVVCFSASGETSISKDAIIEENTPSVVLDTSEKGDPNGSLRKKLLVLDINGLLADFICYVPYGYKPDIIIGQKAVFKRPFCDDFIKFCFEKFEVGVWSSRTRRNVDMVIDFLMGDFRQKLLFCWDQSHCTDTTFSTVENKHKPLVLKEIKKLWKYLKPREFNSSNTLLLDDSPHKALCNPANTAIFPVTYRFRDIDDTSLGPGGDLRVYLEGLSMAENVQKYVEQNPFGQRPITEKNLSWKFYRRIIYFVERQNDRDDTNSFKWN